MHSKLVQNYHQPSSDILDKTQGIVFVVTLDPRAIFLSAVFLRGNNYLFRRKKTAERNIALGSRVLYGFTECSAISVKLVVS